MRMEWGGLTDEWFSGERFATAVASPNVGAEVLVPVDTAMPRGGGLYIGIKGRLATTVNGLRGMQRRTEAGCGRTRVVGEVRRDVSIRRATRGGEEGLEAAAERTAAAGPPVQQTQ